MEKLLEDKQTCFLKSTQNSQMQRDYRVGINREAQCGFHLATGTATPIGGWFLI
jgi:hypothetical protein